MKFKSLLYPVICSLFLLSAARKTEITSISFLQQLSLKDKELTVTARVYSPEESRSILHDDLIARGYIPVEVTIQNQGDHTYGISAASTSLNTTQPKTIAREITKQAVPRGIALKLLSLLFWPFTIPSTIDSIYTFKSHRFMVNSLTAKGFKEKEEIILPFSVVKRLLYVPQTSFYRTFSVSLEDMNDKELIVIPIEVLGV